MVMAKILLGVMVILIGISIWFTMQSSALDVFISSPQDRYNFRENIAQFQFLYFLLIFCGGIIFIVWGASSG